MHKMAGEEQKFIYNVFRHRVEKKAKVIVLSDGNHVLSTSYELLPSDRRYRCLNAKPKAHIAFIP